jgi:hypothetical protein
MLLLSKSLLDQPIMSLRTGGQIAVSTGLIINPNNLKIEGFYCQDRFEKRQLVLLTQDIRDMVPQGIIVDDHDRLSDPEELIRLKDILELEFELLGKSVVTVSKTRLGKVNDFAADSTSLYVQKLYVGQSLLKSFNGGQLSIDRTSIVEITNRHIKVEEIQKPVRAGLTAKITPSTQPS